VPQERSGSVELVTPVDCERDCWAAKKRRWRTGPRRERGCSRVDLPEVEWHVSPSRLMAWYGAPQDDDWTAERWAGRKIPGVAPDRYMHPPEPLSDGCPEGWARAPFAASVVPYIRRRDANGNRVNNPRLDRCADRLVVDAVLYFEGEQESLVARRDELQAAIWERNRGK